MQAGLQHRDACTFSGTEAKRDLHMLVGCKEREIYFCNLCARNRNKGRKKKGNDDDRLGFKQVMHRMLTKKGDSSKVQGTTNQEVNGK